MSEIERSTYSPEVDPIVAKGGKEGNNVFKPVVEDSPFLCCAKRKFLQANLALTIFDIGENLP